MSILYANPYHLNTESQLQYRLCVCDVCMCVLTFGIALCWLRRERISYCYLHYYTGFVYVVLIYLYMHTP